MPRTVETYMRQSFPDIRATDESIVKSLIGSITHGVQGRKAELLVVRVKEKVCLSPSAVRDLAGKLLHHHRLKFIELEYVW